MKKVILNLLLISSIQLVFAQQVTLWGTLKDGTSGETLIGGNVVTNNQRSYTTSNNYGFYSLSLKPGDYIIHYSFMGYNDTVLSIKLTENKELNIALSPVSVALSEINVSSEKGNHYINQPITGIQQISAKTLERIPTLAGEKDVLQGIQSLPGISTGNEGTTSLSVRGGSFDQNLFLLDDAPVYNPAHALSFFSVFNTEAMKDVKVYTGAFPAEFGGRLSSVVDLHMREGNKQHIAGGMELGLLSSRINLEGPIVKDKSSFFISGRYCYAGTIADLAGFFIDDLKGSIIHFYDLNAKFNYQVNNKNHLYLSYYSGNDHFYSKAVDIASSMTWGNQTATFRWNHINNPRLFANYMLIYSNYGYNEIFLDDARNYKWLAGLSQLGTKADYNFYLSSEHKLKFGSSIDYHLFKPGSIESRDDSYEIKPFKLQEKKNLQFSAYVSDEWTINSRLSLYGGLRFANMTNLGEGYVYEYNNTKTLITDSVHYKSGEIINFYNSLEPRVSIRYLINNQSSLKVSYSRNSQFFHLLGNSSIGLPTDIWVPADNEIKPQKADIYSLGFFKSMANNGYELSVETYYKQFANIIDFKDNANLMLNPYVDMEILDGIGRAYGLELSFRKNYGSFTGWINYTLAKNEKKIEGINNGDYFHTRYDKLHNLNVSLMYSQNKRWSFAGIFKISSGGYITMPLGSYTDYGYAVNYYSQRNGYKLPVYHRLDLSVSYHSLKNLERKFKSEWSLSVYNVYNRKNIFSLYAKHEKDYIKISKVYNLYLFGIVPTISYSIKF